MASAFGGQRSIQLSYGCLRACLGSLLIGINRKFAPDRQTYPAALCKQLVAQLQPLDQHVDLFL